MRLYCTPGGTWAGTEKDWKDAMRAEGCDPKRAERKIIDVPTSKAELMEFLTFYNVNVIAPRTSPDVGHGHAPPPIEQPVAGTPTTIPDLNAAFAAAPITVQVELAVNLLDRLETLTRGRAALQPAG